VGGEGADIVTIWKGLGMLGLLLALTSGAEAQQRQRPGEDADRDLVRLSARAESPEQHARVADLLRQRAADLEAQARRAERAARTLEQRRYPYETKLPAISQPGYKERAEARAARAQARAHRALAARHVQSATPVNVEPEP